MEDAGLFDDRLNKNEKILECKENIDGTRLLQVSSINY